MQHTGGRDTAAWSPEQGDVGGVSIQRKLHCHRVRPLHGVDEFDPYLLSLIITPPGFLG